MKRCIAAAMLMAGLSADFAGPAFAVELNPKAIAIRQADELKWRDPTGAAPTNQMVLFGDPTKPGFYMVMNRFKPGSSPRRKAANPLTLRRSEIASSCK
jgi:hypothetical protein